jgi:hypothetical protein
MAADEHRKKEDSEKKTIMFDIQERLDVLGVRHRLDDDKRKDRLKGMTVPELQQLVQDVQLAPTGAEAITLIVNAITDSEHARRRVEDEKDDGLCGPAEMDMDS